VAPGTPVTLETLDGQDSGSSAANDSRGRADDIRLISAGALPIPSMIEYRFVHVKRDITDSLPEILELQ
jgi:hypothetical protein